MGRTVASRESSELRRSTAMGRRLFVGNLSYQTDENELTELFGQFGAVENAQIMRDMATGRARGFAFVEMATDEEAAAAATGLNNTQFGGRTIAVNEARPREQRSGGPGGGGGGRGGRSFGGGGGGGRREPRW
jgi:RNA recognition motif-containing protein